MLLNGRVLALARANVFSSSQKQTNTTKYTQQMNTTEISHKAPI
jgi:hypothetical protein